MPEYIIVRGMIHAKHETSPHRTLCGVVYGEDQGVAKASRGFCMDCDAKEKNPDLVLDR